MELGRIKLEIPDPLDDLFPSKRGRLIIERFHEILDKYGFDFELPTPIVVRDSGCEQLVVVVYELNSPPSLLLATILCFFGSLRKTQLSFYFYPTLIIHSPKYFSTKIISCHKCVPLNAVYFGNIQGGVFFNHWEISYGKMSSNNKGGGKSCRKRNGCILADFLYDQSEILNIRFENRETMSSSRSFEQHFSDKKCYGIAYYEIGIRLPFIRRIVVDCTAPATNDENYKRIYFELNCPVIVRRGFRSLNERKDGMKRVRWRTICRGRTANDVPHDLAIADSPIFAVEFESLQLVTLYEILSRFRMRSGVGIEFASYPMVDVLYHIDNCPYSRWTRDNSCVNAATSPEETIFKKFLAKAVREEDVSYDRSKYKDRPEWVKDIVKERKFSLTYLIECLISRGAVVKDQLLLDVATWRDFLTVVSCCYLRNREVCLSALERIITMIDGKKRLGSVTLTLLNEFEEECKQGITSELSPEENKFGYRKVRKLVITPTRIIYVVPETLMANRVLRGYDHDGTRVLRVSFRDDDNQPMRSFKTSEYLIKTTLRNAMIKGIEIAGRNFGYLGNSNSQMRDGGAYFMEKYSYRQWLEYKNQHGELPPPTWQPKIDHVRLSLGSFKRMENIYKLMARLGQCFTQSKESNVVFERSEYCVIPDVVGGCNKAGDSYIFSDGVGMMSKGFAQQIAADMMLGKCLPSCFQFRFRGMKGVLAVNPLLDDVASWAVNNGLSKEDHFFGSWVLKMVFRESQVKFLTDRGEKESIEIVKYSGPSAVALNKPLISILDQVSEMQSHECHIRVTNRIEQLAEEHLRSLARSLLYEKECRNTLKELPLRIHIDRLSVVAGFSLSTEPFFRSLVKAKANYFIVKHMRRQQFPIPNDKARTMFGVFDETGQLQYGQVFVQYTVHINLRNPPISASRKVLTGKIMLTKSPSLVAGDVRIFDAIDVPDLHHFCDVIVFPQHGPRPHPDEMAGSDLDGDEYAVIWDEELMLEKSEEAFDYTAEKAEQKPINKETMSEEMVDFYTNYIIQDSIGVIANSFQFQSDLYGVKSEICGALARKYSQAVDFPKTGRAPSPLTRDWSADGKPPEKHERQPDYHFTNDFRFPSYRSERLLGSVYRNIRALDDVRKMSQDEGWPALECDEYIVVDGWTDALELANYELSRYNGRLRVIMEHYSIKSEAEVFSGCFLEIRHRISDRDQDDMSFFTTNDIIEMKITELFRSFREEFFEEFGGWTNCLEQVSNPYEVLGNVLNHHTNNPSLRMQKKAVAYYRACYELAKKSGELLLSFAWLAYDVLAVVKQRNIVKDENYCPSTFPLFEILSSQLDIYYKQNEEKLSIFVQYVAMNSHLRRYIQCYPGLDRILFVVAMWAVRNRLVVGCLHFEHLCILLVLFATGRIAGSMNIFQPLLDVLDGAEIEGNEPIAPTSEQYVHMLVSFYEYLASREFRKLPHLSFTSLGCSSIFLRGQWLPIHEAAVRTYYNLVFNMQFGELTDMEHIDPSRDISSQEWDPFVVELPEDINEQLMKLRIVEKTGVTDLSIRRRSGAKSGAWFTVSARGTVHSLCELRDLLTAKSLIKTSARGREISALLPQLVYENIMSR
ncbi:hypothetical protein RB195_004073 [Necator americanus]|uniref:RNA-directed RNA polymerase n=1 Tax=Necator americanus TaxID=51031 RepID=A0ABR1BI09_NECAM